MMFAPLYAIAIRFETLYEKKCEILSYINSLYEFCFKLMVFPRKWKSYSLILNKHGQPQHPNEYVLMIYVEDDT